MKKSNCLNCQERTSDCHTYCETYKAFKSERDAEKKKIIKSRNEYSDMYGYLSNKAKRLKKMRNGE